MGAIARMYSERESIAVVMVVGGPGVGEATIFQRFMRGDGMHSFEAEAIQDLPPAMEYTKEWTIAHKQVSVSIIALHIFQATRQSTACKTW